MKPILALLGLLLLAGCVVPPQQPYYVTRPFTYAPQPAPAIPEQPYQPAPVVFQPPTPLASPSQPPQPETTPDADPVTASVPQPAPSATEVPQASSPIQKTTTPDTNTNVPMMGFRPMRGQKPPGA